MTYSPTALTIRATLLRAIRNARVIERNGGTNRFMSLATARAHLFLLRKGCDVNTIWFRPAF